MPIIDADARVIESEHTWDYIDEADQKYRPLIKPCGEGSGQYWYVDGKIRSLVRAVQVAEPAERSGGEIDTAKKTCGSEDVAARLKHMDEVGIDVQVLSPTLFS